MSATFTGFGFDQLQRQLLAMSDTAKAGKLLRSSVRKAFAPVVTAAQRGAKKKDGTPDTDLAAAVALAVVVPRNDSDIAIRVGLKIGRKAIPLEVLDGADEGVAQLIVTLKRKAAGFRWHFREQGVKAHIVRARVAKLATKRANAKRAIKTEYGSPAQAAIPFIRPAADLELAACAPRLAANIGKGLERVARSGKAE